MWPYPMIDTRPRPACRESLGVGTAAHIRGALILLSLLCLALPACQAGDRKGVALQTGDLLFQDTDGGPLCDAIRAVTEGVEGAKFTHMGILFFDRGQPMVVEAGGKGVKITSLMKFLDRSKDDHGRPRVVVGRLKDQYRGAIGPSVERALALVGKPYNDEFVLGNGKYYCSQLVYETYMEGKGGQHLFEVQPMTFCRPGSHEPFPAWKDYFASRKMPIPEDMPGCNPGGLSRSQKLAIVCAFGRPTGWTEATYRQYDKPRVTDGASAKN